MKKIVGIIVGIIIVVIAVFGYKYYQNTYASQTAYAKVSSQVPEKVATKNADGKIVADSYSYNYTFTFVKEDGTKQTMEYELADASPVPLTPNSYVTAEISKTRINQGPNAVNESDIPAKVLKVLKAQ